MDIQNLRLSEVPGFDELEKWFGRHPSFHDAEVTAISLDRSKGATVVVHAFEPTTGSDPSGRPLFLKHVLVRFVMTDIVDVSLSGFNKQNVLSGLFLERSGDSHKLVLEGVHGVEGTLIARGLRIELTPGMPDDSQYAHSPAE